MIINNVRIFPNPRAAESNLKATATMVINNEILLQSIRVMKTKNEDGESALRVSYPVQKLNNGSLRHCVYPSSGEARQKYDSAVLEAYQKVINGEVEGNTVVFSEDTGCLPHEISRISLYPSMLSESHRAKISLELDGELWLRGMFLTVRNDGSLVLLMPRRQIEAGHWLDYYHPLNQEARDNLTKEVIAQYQQSPLANEV